MAELEVTFLSAILQVTFDRMASREVVDFFQGRKLTERLLRKLKIAVLSVNVVLEDAEEKQLTKPIVKDWIDELKDALYSAEDILDEIATEALQCKLDDEFLITTGKVRNCISSTFLNPFVHRIEPRIKEVIDRLEDLAKQKDYMGLQGVGEKQSERLPTTSLVEESSIVGRDDDKEAIINSFLTDDTRKNEKGVIAIIGMGGIGKSTLAKLVFNDNRMNELFDLKTWFCVSEEFVIPKVMKSIMEAVTLQDCNIEDLDRLQVKLNENLKGEKFLLVLDDVWSEQPVHQEFLGELLKYGSQGSKIFITTRSTSVATAMHTVANYPVGILNDEDCWLLFTKHAFRSSSFPGQLELEEIGKTIVKKCDGLPLAIKTIGDLLWSERDVEKWKRVLNSDLWCLPAGEIYILPALILSYKYLPSYLKQCFAYCSIFPKDYIFEKNQIILLWMAEGFLKQSQKETMEEVGNRYFLDLVSRSFFQQSSGTNSSFVMHDLVNDLAKFVSGKFSFMFEGDSSQEIVKMTRYLSYFGGSLCSATSKKIDKDLCKAKKLRTILALDSSPWGSEIRMPRLWCLRVLSLSYNWTGTKLPNSVGKMIHLRYLDLSFTCIERLPNSMCNLYNLQTLKLSGCSRLGRFPRDMWKLVTLRHLDLDGTSVLKKMPIRMGRLKCLQTLTKFIIGKDDGSCIGELGRLSKLKGKLSIWDLQNVESVKDALGANLKDRDYLEELVFQWNVTSDKLNISDIQRGVLENLQPHKNLKRLTINNYDGESFPNWLGLPLFSNIAYLDLRNCKYCSALPPLGQLSSLNELVVDGFDGVVTVGPEFYGNNSSTMKPFGMLKSLRFENMSNWEKWFPFGAENEGGAFPQLEKLYIVMCPKLRGRLPVHRPSLVKLEISECSHFESSLPIDLFPKLTLLEILGCEDLESLAVSEQHEHDGITDLNSCLHTLIINHGLSLISLPRGDSLSALKMLLINDCKKLELPMHWQYSSLSELSLTASCDSLTFFPLDLFPKLKSIEIYGCMNLESLEQHGCDSMISQIKIHNCPNFVSFPKGGLRAPALTKFSIGCFKRLRSMPDKMHLLLPSLQSLEILDCPEVESFPEGGLPSNLKEITIRRCNKLNESRMGWGLQKLSSLVSLKIDGETEDAESFPGTGLLPSSLTHLGIYEFEKLECLDNEGFQHLNSLQQLEIRRCPKIEYLPEEGLPASLDVLNLGDCPVVRERLQRPTGKEWRKITRVRNVIIDEGLQDQNTGKRKQAKKRTCLIPDIPAFCRNKL